MREFIAECNAHKKAPSLKDWAKVSCWAQDTGGLRDAAGSPLRAQRGVWKTLFDQVMEEGARRTYAYRLRKQLEDQCAPGTARSALVVIV